MTTQNSTSLFPKGGKNIVHWHGASANSQFVHIAITNYKGDKNVVWLKPVTDEEYNEVNKK